MSEPRNDKSDTRDRILDVAERLFMEFGHEATSMRQITSAAGVNLAAVNYHFGSKEMLVHQVFRRRLDWINDERLRVLDRMQEEAGGKPLKASQIVDAYFGTLLRTANDPERGGMTFLKLLGRAFTDPSDFIRAFMADEYRVVVERYKEALFQALPDVPKVEIVWRFHFMLGATSYAIAGTDLLQVVTDWQIESDEGIEQVDRLLPRLMSFLIGGLRAPLPKFEQT